VSSAGDVRALAQGSAAVTAEFGGARASVSVNVAVAPVATVTLSPASASLPEGVSVALRAQLADVAGKELTGRPVAWASSDRAVATVSGDGQVQAVKAGRATITATAEGKTATASITVMAPTPEVESIASVTVTPSTASIPVGASLSLVATPKDASGNALSDRAVSWKSQNTTIATVSSAGVVKAVATGTATITATSEGKSGTSLVTVTAPVVPVASVTLSPTSLTLDPGATRAISAFIKDAAGNLLSGRELSWASSNTAVATVGSDGVVKAVAAGTATITAMSEGKSGTLVMTVNAPVAPPPTGSSVAELPRVRVETRYVAPTGKTIFVPAGGDLQKALNDAQRGDVITLAAGATYTGSFTLPQKAGSGWITIRPEASVSLPAEGTRMSPAQASKLPKLITPGTEAALRTAPRASQYRIVGVEIAAAPSVTLNYGLVLFGDGSEAQNSLDLVPSHLILDRVYVHGQPGMNLKRCVTLSSAHSAVIDSYLSECHYKGADSQSILGWNGPGPFKIENNYLEGAGENVMFGGAATSIRGLVPSDIEIVRNHFYKPPAWKGIWSAKNLLEFKVGQRVLVEGNVFENSWTDGQVGYAVVMTPTAEVGENPWSVVRDVTFRNNWIRGAEQGFQLHADYVGVTEHQRRVLIENNLITALSGQAFYLASDLEDIVIQRNTMVGGRLHSALYLESSDAPIRRLVYRDNVIGASNYGLFTSQGEGTRGLVANTTGGYTVQGNVFVGRSASAYPAGNYFPGSNTEIGFVNPTAGDYRISSTSVLAKSIAGPMPGVDMDALTRATSGVVR
jgi:uncharacterized protein YjdB